MVKTVPIKEELHSRAKIKSISLGVNLQTFVEEAVNEKLEREE